MDHIFSPNSSWSPSEFHPDVSQDDLDIPDCLDSWMNFQPQYAIEDVCFQQNSTSFQQICARGLNDGNDIGIASMDLGAIHAGRSPQAKQYGTSLQDWPQNAAFSTRKRTGEPDTEDDTSRGRKKFLKRQKHFEEEQLRTRYELLANSISAINILDLSDDQKLQASRDTGLSILQIEVWLQLRQTTLDITAQDDMEVPYISLTDNFLSQTCSSQASMEDSNLLQISGAPASGPTSGAAAFASTRPTRPSSLDMSCTTMDEDPVLLSPLTVFNPCTDQFARRLHSVYGGDKVLCWLDTLSAPEENIYQTVSSETRLQGSLGSSSNVVEFPETGVPKQSYTETGADFRTTEELIRKIRITEELVRKITSNVIEQLKAHKDRFPEFITPDPSELKDVSPDPDFQQKSSCDRSRAGSQRGASSHSSIGSNFSMQDWSARSRKGRSNTEMSRQKQSSGRYFCTYCDQTFSQSSAWQRHEFSKHTPLHVWVCKPLLTDQGGHSVCIACHQSHHTRDCKHATKACWNKDVSERLFTRADSLQQHFRGHHRISWASKNLTAEYKEAMNTEVVREYDVRCRIAGCDHVCKDLYERFSHIESHVDAGCRKMCWRTLDDEVSGGPADNAFYHEHNLHKQRHRTTI